MMHPMTPSDADPTALRMTLFTGALSQRGYHINKFAKSLTTVPGRAVFAADPRSTMAGFGLTETEMDLVEASQWQALLDRGAAIYLLAKIAIAQGGTLMDIGAQMRGQTAVEFSESLRAARARRKEIT
jgi:protocatechuate 4,5-dioxygenase alpha subunit